MSKFHTCRNTDTHRSWAPAWAAITVTALALCGPALAQTTPPETPQAPIQPPAQPPAVPPAQPDRATGDTPSGGPLFIDDSHDPMVMIAWVKRDGTRVELTRTLPWGTQNDRVDLGLNVMAFAAVGGTRIDLQRGHPLGSVVRMGFYKADKSMPFFADIQPGSTIEVRLQNVRFLEPARPTVTTALHHLQYNLQDVLDCGLDASAIDQYNTAQPDDTLGGNITQDNGRPGVLRVVNGELPTDAPRYFRQGGDPTGDKDPQPAERFATVRFSVQEDTGAVSIRAELPYEIFRHVRDPWLRAEPGTFFEPTHFHVEFESLPVRAYPGKQPPPDRDSREEDAQPEAAGS